MLNNLKVLAGSLVLLFVFWFMSLALYSLTGFL